MAPHLSLSLGLALLMGSHEAGAQEAEPNTAADRKVEGMIVRAKEAYGPPDKRKRCEPGKGDEIVVCAGDDGKRWRIPPTSETDPTSREATRGGVPRAPDLEKHYPGVTVAKGCFIPPCPPPPAYMIDLSTIPEAPAGSDADKIAKGEMRAP